MVLHPAALLAIAVTVMVIVVEDGVGVVSSICTGSFAPLQVPLVVIPTLMLAAVLYSNPAGNNKTIVPVDDMSCTTFSVIEGPVSVV